MTPTVTGPDNRGGRSDDEVEQYWTSFVTEGSVSDGTKLLITTDLRVAWDWERYQNYRRLIKVEQMPVDHTRVTLDDAVTTIEHQKFNIYTTDRQHYMCFIFPRRLITMAMNH